MLFVVVLLIRVLELGALIENIMHYTDFASLFCLLFIYLFLFLFLMFLFYVSRANRTTNDENVVCNISLSFDVWKLWKLNHNTTWDQRSGKHRTIQHQWPQNMNWKSRSSSQKKKHYTQIHRKSITTIRYNTLDIRGFQKKKWRKELNWKTQFCYKPIEIFFCFCLGHCSEIFNISY